MKIVGITSTALLSLLLGIAVPAYAQNEKQDHSEQQQGRHEQGKPEKQQRAQSPQHAQQQHRYEEGTQAHQAQQQDRNTGQQHAQQQQRSERDNRPQQQETGAISNSVLNSSSANGKGHHSTISASRQVISNGTINRSAVRNSSACNRARGNSIAHNTGIPITATGDNVAAIADTAFLKTVFVDTSVPVMGSASTACRSWSWADTRASSTRVTG